jgi:class 3 adenylate cyclase
MKRKIAAILAADIAGYSKLVAEDEEETLRRLASYRAVFDDFIAKSGGRIFNTAGDAVLAEFQSAVEAVRCAIDVQESLRTRNLAYPPSRQMNFRMGISIGDVVERDGDLLGDGVNIAARLEGLAEPGGICVSRSVYEQVSNKLSVQFADIGEQEVKNIPTPVHAFMVALKKGNGATASSAGGKGKGAAGRSGVTPVHLMAGGAALVALAVLGLVLWRGAPQTAASIQQPSAFEGTWRVTVDCPQEPGGAKGFTLRFVSEVKDGVLHGQNGTEGLPGSLTLRGKILPDGTAWLNANGLTGNPASTIGGLPAGTIYRYSVRARFEGSKGTGTRDQGRVCNFDFAKE